MPAQKTHGMSKTPEYWTWWRIRGRCYSPKHHNYARYGGRGIRVCTRWLDSFHDFLSDMGPKPSPKHSIERLDNDGDYEPGNCIWATAQKQNSNRTTVVLVTAFGKTQSVSEWSRETGIGRLAITYRLRTGVPPEVALSQNGRLKR